MTEKEKIVGYVVEKNGKYLSRNLFFENPNKGIMFYDLRYKQEAKCFAKGNDAVVLKVTVKK